ncbi:response regulator [Paraflavisolibacter sp. H34]|uniref:response regulator n=1 Tax=Huijunlia imazamoxiresistens TaxID=3127457 RepID=UPI0030191803
MNKEVHILLVEDNEGDIVLTREAMHEAQLHNKMDVARDGEEALQFLRKEGRFREAVTPDLILMDINLPRLDGKEVLSIIKMDDFLKIIPVIMLTTSNSEKDVMESYLNHANCYITKPVKLSDFMDVIHTIRDFWISIVKLPKTHDHE